MNRPSVARALSFDAACLLPLVLLLAPGRANAQDTATAASARVGILPVIGTAPETGLQYGVTAFRLYHAADDTATRPSVDQVTVTNTVKRQLKASIQTERWSQGNRWRFRGRLEYQDYPMQYFGIGPSTREDSEEWYVGRVASLHVQAHRQIRPSTYVIGGFRFTRTTLSDLDSSGALIDRTIVGSTGGNVSQLQLGVLRDSRDNIFSAHSGAVVQATVSVSVSALGADYDFTRVDVDLRRYLRLGQFVVAGQAQFQSSAGDTPFDQLPAIGADTAIRGYTRGRYRDQHLLSAQLEMRSPYWRRVGLVAFAGAGTVGARIGDLTRHAWQPGVGAGLRYMLFPRERTLIRVDFGSGRGSSGLYLGINEAF